MILHIILYSILVTGLIVTYFANKEAITDLEFEVLQKDGLINSLKDSVKFWQVRCRMKDDQIELYEKVVDKIVGDRPLETDTAFIFEGNFYRPMNFTLDRNPGEPDTLTVEFVKMGVPKTSKGEKE